MVVGLFKMKTRVFGICSLAFVLLAIKEIHTSEENKTENVSRHLDISTLKIENNFNQHVPIVKKPRQDDGDNEDGQPVLSQAQLQHVGNNVVKVITSSLFGNPLGVFDGALNLLNTRNRVVDTIERVVGTPSTTVKTTPKPNITSTVATNEDEEDDDEES